MLSWMGASLVAMKRVPMLMPSAPRARQAAIWVPVPMPPEATMGMSSTLAAAGSSTRLVTSSSPGWPAHSKPSTDTAAQPRLWAFREWRTEVHLWITLTPCSLNRGMNGSGLRPAVSTIFTPASTMAWAYSS